MSEQSNNSNNNKEYNKTVFLYDTLTAKKREFVPLVKNEVSMYYCGPTVYNHPHVGNIRPVIVFDLLSRVFKELGYNVKCARNYTDIDDKIINKALESNKSELDVSKFYIEAFDDVCNKLNVLPLYERPKVSDCMSEIISFIDELIKKNKAYKSGNDVFFDVKSVPTYGELSKMKLDTLDNGIRVTKNENKKNEQDFVLWKLTDDNGIKFEAPFGRGRPGWHTECVVMINKVFKKDKIDIHGGGFDLKFPHHENELAQSEACHDSKLADYWMHVGFVNVDGEKMSKSLGNGLLAKDLLNQYSGNTLRMFFYSSHYRSPVNFSDDTISEADSKVKKYIEVLQKLSYKFSLDNKELKGEVKQEEYHQFMSFLQDDLNVNNSLVVVENVCKQINQNYRTRDYNYVLNANLFVTLYKLLSILGFEIKLKDLSSEDRKLYNDYLISKENKNYELSDSLRKELISKGII